MAKYHLKTILKEGRVGEVHINEKRFRNDLSESLRDVLRRFSLASFEEISIEELSSIKKTFDLKLKTEFDLSVLSFKELKKLISVFAYSDEISSSSSSSYSHDERKVQKLVNKVEELESVPLAKRLWKNLLQFDEGYSEHSRELINKLCLNIFSQLKNEANSSKRLMKMHDEFSIFSNKCYKVIALKLLNENDREVLERLYMTLFDFQTSFGERVVYEITQQLEKYLINADIKKVSHVTTVLSDIDGIFIVNKSKYSFIGSLLLAYKGRNVTENVIQIISTFVERNIGDPRIRKEWSYVDSEAKKVYLRWKVSASTELFFKVISENANNKSTELRYRWSKREKFWRKYLDQDLIQSAWLVLTSEGESHYRRFFSKDSTVPYGKINGPDSMLILYIDNLQIVEFAPTGQVSIWKDGDRNAPEGYKGRYIVEDIRIKYNTSPILVTKHDSGGHWMDEVKMAIYKETNIKLK